MKGSFSFFYRHTAFYFVSGEVKTNSKGVKMLPIDETNYVEYGLVGIVYSR
jgi:hypothetical protein